LFEIMSESTPIAPASIGSEADAPAPTANDRAASAAASEAAPVSSGQHQFPCKNCGANLVFEPGTTSLKCPYCGVENQIAASSNAAVQEQDYLAELQQTGGAQETSEVLTVRCGKCGAETTLGANQPAGRCPFCGSPIVAQALSKRLIKPKSLLPFRITQSQAADLFKRWINSRWFAPSELKKRADREQINGVYIPCWTYDSQTTTDYTGQRGEDYWDTETYSSFENGRSVTRTRQVRRTRWWPASGTVQVPFDDVLVLASRSLPPRYANALEPWDLQDLVPYQDEYLSGFVAESYQIDLEQGFETAKTIMAGPIRHAICSDIGGDHQQISSAETTYNDVTFKHALLPVWISAYLYAGKTYHFLVNARTGELQGQRPWSPIKIGIAILIGIIVLMILLLIFNGGR
jgi:DNA-directed RNA polymerase subunit RPC12/RpoP